MAGKDYLSIIYNEKDRPFTKYPDQLAAYLVKRYQLSENKKILDLGCGRGEFLKGFVGCHLDGYGVDQFRMAQSVCAEAKIIQSDLDKQPLPYQDNFFDYIFSKSVLEHFYYPEKLVKEIYRILKPGGLVITMVPDWASGYKIFYDDCTHRTPFTQVSLRRIFFIHNFAEVKVEKFRQLPFLWSRPWLQPFAALVAGITPRKLSPYSKLIRFSKEIMLLSTAIKPDQKI